MGSWHYPVLNTLLYCTALYSTLYSTLYCTLLPCTLHCTQHSTVLYCPVLYTVLNTLLYSTALYSTLYSTLYCNVLPCTLHCTQHSTVLQTELGPYNFFVFVLQNGLIIVNPKQLCYMTPYATHETDLFCTNAQ